MIPNTTSQPLPASNLKPQTPKFGTNPNPGAPNPEPGTRNPEPGTRTPDPEPETWHQAGAIAGVATVLVLFARVAVSFLQA